MNGLRPGKVILDELNSEPTTMRELIRGIKQPTLKDEIQRILRRCAQPCLSIIDEVSNYRPLKIKRLPIEDFKLTHEIKKPHGAEYICSVGKWSVKTGRWSANTDSGG